jgi:hypothetical protein
MVENLLADFHGNPPNLKSAGVKDAQSDPLGAYLFGLV